MNDITINIYLLLGIMIFSYAFGYCLAKLVYDIGSKKSSNNKESEE